jgi:DNA-binding SARP family transcriptional activator
MQLSVNFLGPFQVRVDGSPAVFATDRARALLAYLALENGQPHRREALAGLLWPEQPNTLARQDLSQALVRLRRAICDYQAQPPFLEVSAKTIQLNTGDICLDVTSFAAWLDECERHDHSEIAGCPGCVDRLERAIGLYRGEFLQGLFLEKSQPFEEWLRYNREKFSFRAMRALHILTGVYLTQGFPERAQQYAARQLAMEPWREEAHRQMMRAQALLGNRARAMAQYQLCRLVLARELGIAPDPSTQALYEQVKTGRMPAL